MLLKLKPLKAQYSTTVLEIITQVQFNFDDKCINKDKQLLTIAPVFAHYDPNASAILTVDASPTGLGCVLSIADSEGVECPVSLKPSIKAKYHSFTQAYSLFLVSHKLKAQKDDSLHGPLWCRLQICNKAGRI